MASEGPSEGRNYEFIINKNGGKSLLIAGHSYTFKRKTKTSSVWVCSNRRHKKCNGSVKLVKESDSVEIQNRHRLECQPNFSKNAVSVAMEKIKKEVTTTSESVRKIFESHTAELRKKGFNADIPAFQDVKSTLYNHRKIALKAIQTDFKIEDSDKEDEGDVFTEVVYLEEEAPKGDKKTLKINKVLYKDNEKVFRSTDTANTASRNSLVKRRKLTESEDSDDEIGTSVASDNVKMKTEPEITRVLVKKPRPSSFSTKETKTPTSHRLTKESERKESESDELEKFGAYVASLLRSLPKKVCATLQLNIVSQIMQEKLKLDNNDEGNNSTANTENVRTEEANVTESSGDQTDTEASSSTRYKYTITDDANIVRNE